MSLWCNSSVAACYIQGSWLLNKLQFHLPKSNSHCTNLGRSVLNTLVYQTSILIDLFFYKLIEVMSHIAVAAV